MVCNHFGCISGSAGRFASSEVLWDTWPLTECRIKRLVINSFSFLEVHDSAEIDLGTPVE